MDLDPTPVVNSASEQLVDNATHPDFVQKSDPCQRAIVLGRQFEHQKWELAELLGVIRKQKEWRSTGADCFEAFVVEHVRLSLRTAQELIRLRDKCEALKIPREMIDKLGWSKLATVASSLNKDNKDRVLGDVGKLPLTELRSKYPSTATAKSVHQVSKLQLSESIQQALRQAARHTLSNETQANLEFVCEQFCATYPFAKSRIPASSGN